MSQGEDALPSLAAQHQGKFLQPSLEEHPQAALITGRDLESAQMPLTTLGFALEPNKTARVVKASPSHSPLPRLEQHGASSGKLGVLMSAPSELGASPHQKATAALELGKSKRCLRAAGKTIAHAHPSSPASQS